MKIEDVETGERYRGIAPEGTDLRIGIPPRLTYWFVTLSDKDRELLDYPPETDLLP